MNFKSFKNKKNKLMIAILFIYIYIYIYVYIYTMPKGSEILNFLHQEHTQHSFRGSGHVPPCTNVMIAAMSV